MAVPRPQWQYSDQALDPDHDHALYARNTGIPTDNVAGPFSPPDDIARLHTNDEPVSRRDLTLTATYTTRPLRGIAARP